MNYKFKCPSCGYHKIEEVMNEVTQTSVLTDIYMDPHVGLICEYEPYPTTDGGDTETLQYQCMMCGTAVSSEDMEALATPVP